MTFREIVEMPAQEKPREAGKQQVACYGELGA